MVIAARFGHVQTMLILVLFYVILLGPVSLFQAVGRRDQLDKRLDVEEGERLAGQRSGGNDLERAKLLS
jgi:hypothetical protein